MSKQPDSPDSKNGHVDDELLPPTSAETSYLRRQQLPYAKLSVTLRVEEVSQTVAARVSESTEGTVSQAAFDAESRSILGSHMPALEKHRLRPHYIEFIRRNKVQAPSIRFRTLSLLRKYDLSAIPGIEARFNREKDELTEAKLREIEKLAGVER